MQTVESKIPVPQAEGAIPEGWGRVYALSDPRNPRLPVYVGMTTTTLRERLWSHFSEARKKKNERRPLSEWMRKTRSDGVNPVIYTLEIAPKDTLLARENFWIVFFRPLGALLNAHDGIGGLGEKMKQRGGTRAATAPHLKAANESRKIRVIDNFGFSYPSIREAARIVGARQSHVKQSIKNGWKCKGRIFHIAEQQLN